MLLLARESVTATEMKSETKHLISLLEHQILPTFPSFWRPSFVSIISDPCPIPIKVFLPGQSFTPSYQSLDYSIQWFINTLKLEGSYTLCFSIRPCQDTRILRFRRCPAGLTAHPSQPTHLLEFLFSLPAYLMHI